MNPDPELYLNQITEDSELLKSTLLLIKRLKEIRNDPPNTSNYHETIGMLALMAHDIADRLDNYHY